MRQIFSWNRINGIWHLLKSNGSALFERNAINANHKWKMSCSEKTSVQNVREINTSIPKHAQLCLCFKCLYSYKGKGDSK